MLSFFHLVEQWKQQGLLALTANLSNFTVYLNGILQCQQPLISKCVLVHIRRGKPLSHTGLCAAQPQQVRRNTHAAE